MEGGNIKRRFIGSTSIFLWRKDWSAIRHDRTKSFFMKHSQLTVSWRISWWKWRKHLRQHLRHLDLLWRCPFKIIGWNDWVQKLLEEVNTPNKIKNPIINHGIIKHGETCSELVRSLSKSTKVSCLAPKEAMYVKTTFHETIVEVWIFTRNRLEGMLSRSTGMPSRKKWAAKHLGHAWYIG